MYLFFFCLSFILLYHYNYVTITKSTKFKSKSLKKRIIKKYFVREREREKKNRIINFK